jgi:hypothetical protein
VIYADASALVKLVQHEEGSEAVAELLAAARDACSSLVVAIEVELAARRGRGDEGASLARAVLRELTLLDFGREIAAAAARLAPLRALEAIHLASALSLGHAVEGFVTYDRRLGAAARGAGLTVLAPA